MCFIMCMHGVVYLLYIATDPDYTTIVFTKSVEATQPACKKYNQNDEGNNYEKTDKNVFCVKLRPLTMYVVALL